MPNPNLTPLQFLRQYHNLTASYQAPNSTAIQQFTGIKLQRYYINYRGPSAAEFAAKIEENKKDGLTDAEKKENRALQNKIAVANKTASLEELARRLRKGKAKDIAFSINEVRYGKGLPEDYEMVLNAAIAAGLCNVGKDGPPTRQSVQKFLDDSRLGIDCSGYVSAFFVARGDLAESSQGNVTRLNAAAWGDRKGNTRITSIKDIRSGDCLVAVKSNGKLLTSPGHIMLANAPGQADGHPTMEFGELNVSTGKGGKYLGESNGSVYLCESRGGGGLQHGPASFKEGFPNKKHDYFQIRRHGLSNWLKCIVIRPEFKKGS